MANVRPRETIAEIRNKVAVMRFPYADHDSVALAEIQQRLTDCARRKELIAYADLVRGITFKLPTIAQGLPLQLGVPEWIELHSAILKDFLNRASFDSYSQHGVFVSAVAVRKNTGEPSDGFRALVAELRLFHSSRRDDLIVFWGAELKKLYDFYAGEA